MKEHVVTGILWTLAATIIAFWLIAYAKKVSADWVHTTVIVHGKVCPAPSSTPSGGR